MILKNQHQQPWILSSTTTFLYSAGISFCSLIWLLTIYFMVTLEFDLLNYCICKRLIGFSYLELTSFIFIGFSILGLLALPSRRKIYSSALIVSCLSITINTGLLRESARIGHAESIQSFERIMKTSEVHPINIPRVKQRYSIAVDLWRELENTTFKPMADAYWTEDAKTMVNEDNYMIWELTEIPPSKTVPAKLFCSSNERAMGILPDGTRLFGFSNTEAANTNEFLDNSSFPELIAINLRAKDISIEISAQKLDGMLVANFYIKTDVRWDSGSVQYIAAQPIISAREP